jgi:hypothetical protein
MTFLSHVAFEMFVRDKDYLTLEAFEKVETAYFEFYRSRLPKDARNVLTRARVLSHADGDGFRFRYAYCFYFFVARYLRDNIHTPGREA